MILKTRFSEGKDSDWQEICVSAVSKGYDVRVAVPTCVVVDTEAKTVRSSDTVEPNTSIDILREELGMIDLGDDPGWDEENEGNTIINEGTLSVVTSSTTVSIVKGVVLTIDIS